MERLRKIKRCEYDKVQVELTNGIFNFNIMEIKEEQFDNLYEVNIFIQENLLTRDQILNIQFLMSPEYGRIILFYWG